MKERKEEQSCLSTPSHLHMNTCGSPFQFSFFLVFSVCTFFFIHFSALSITYSNPHTKACYFIIKHVLCALATHNRYSLYIITLYIARKYFYFMCVCACARVQPFLLAHLFAMYVCNVNGIPWNGFGEYTMLESVSVALFCFFFIRRLCYPLHLEFWSIFFYCCCHSCFAIASYSYYCLFVRELRNTQMQRFAAFLSFCVCVCVFEKKDKNRQIHRQSACLAAFCAHTVHFRRNQIVKLKRTCINAGVCAISSNEFTTWNFSYSHHCDKYETWVSSNNGYEVRPCQRMTLQWHTIICAKGCFLYSSLSLSLRIFFKMLPFAI